MADDIGQGLLKNPEKSGGTNRINYDFIRYDAQLTWDAGTLQKG